MRVAIITNMPAPYRVPAWNRVAERLGENFLVIFCCHREPNRNWEIRDMKFNHVFLKENFSVKRDGTTFVHNNKDVWKHLKTFNPDVIITGGFNPTMLYAFVYSILKRKKHVSLSDGWRMTERNLSLIHKALRYIVFKSSCAFIACSMKGKEHFKSFSIKEEAIYVSHLTILDAPHTSVASYEAREYDILFSSRFVKGKSPIFFVRVAFLLKQSNKKIKVLIIGEGPLKDEVLEQLKKYEIDFFYAGHVSQEELFKHYSNSKLFLFPTLIDAWGVVANEALTAGTPILITPYAGCTEELVINQFNGYILNLDEQLWVDHCLELLNDRKKWEYFSNNALSTAAKFTHVKAAIELIKACEFCLSEELK
jgi:glycosyltransferase involved in cell wall biosynthesis